jgi:hypothetical protein
MKTNKPILCGVLAGPHHINRTHGLRPIPAVGKLRDYLDCGRWHTWALPLPRRSRIATKRIYLSAAQPSLYCQLLIIVHALFAYFGNFSFSDALSIRCKWNRCATSLIFIREAAPSPTPRPALRARRAFHLALARARFRLDPRPRRKLPKGD